MEFRYEFELKLYAYLGPEYATFARELRKWNEQLPNRMRIKGALPEESLGLRTIWKEGDKKCKEGWEDLARQIIRVCWD
jgi:hypothetical protein